MIKIKYGDNSWKISQDIVDDAPNYCFNDFIKKYPELEEIRDRRIARIAIGLKPAEFGKYMREGYIDYQIIRCQGITFNIYNEEQLDELIKINSQFVSELTVKRILKKLDEFTKHNNLWPRGYCYNNSIPKGSAIRHPLKGIKYINKVKLADMLATMWNLSDVILVMSQIK